MKTSLSTLLPVVAVAAVASAQSPSTPAPGTAVHAVTYLDVLPPQADAARTLLVQQTLAERNQRGCLASELLQEQGRPNHFMLVEAWNDEAALDSYHATEGYQAFRAALQPVIGSPLDERRAQQITPPKPKGASR